MTPTERRHAKALKDRADYDARQERKRRADEEKAQRAADEKRRAEEAARLREERDRLRQVLACERGEWAPDGWRRAPFTYTAWERSDLFCCRVSQARPGPSEWEVHRVVDVNGKPNRFGPVVATGPTALEAIEAAERAVVEKAP